MNELNKQTEQSEVAPATPSGIARRRMILASLGKGATVAAAVAVPMKTLAAIGTPALLPSGKRCTISGNLSTPHSIETAKPLCAGASPNYYSNINNWPSDGSIDIYGGSGSFNKNTSFNDSGLFGSGSSAQLIEILTNSPSSDEAHWIAALLNGTPGSYGANNNFPYTAAEVIGFYKSVEPLRSNALDFFKFYMETYNPGVTATLPGQNPGGTAASRGPTFFQRQ